MHKGSRFLAPLVMVGASLLGGTPSRMNVQVMNGQVRDTPTYLAKVLATAGYGSSVEILQVKGDWMQVRTAQGQKGWMHKSALTTRKISLSAGTSAAKTGASSSDLALAGKGFNADVEREFRTKNKNLDFAAVDRLEAIRIPAQELATFLRTGAVDPGDGGAK